MRMETYTKRLIDCLYTSVYRACAALTATRTGRLVIARPFYPDHLKARICQLSSSPYF